MLAELSIFGANLEEIKELVTILGTVFGALATGGAAVWRWVWVPSSKIIKNIDAIHDLVQNHLPILIKISEEFRPNGGSSMKDALNRVEKHQRLNHQRMKLMQTDKLQYEANEKGECIWVSPRLAELAGMDDSKFIGNGWINAVEHDDRQEVWDEWQKAIIQKRDFSFEFRLAKNNLKVKSYATVVKDSKNQTIGMIGEISA